MIRERERTGTFLSTFVFLFERTGMSQLRFADYINAHPLPEDLKEDPRYRHPLPLNQGTISRILAGSIPDENTLYRIARLGFNFSIELCSKLEDIRWEAYLISQEEKRTTQQMASVRKEPEKKKIVEEEGEQLPKIPAWIFS